MLNYVDLVLLLLVLLNVARGWQRGLLLGLLDVCVWLGSLLVALRLYQPLAGWLAPRLHWTEAWDRPVAFVLTAILASLTISLLGYLFLGRLPHAVRHSLANHALGVAPGLVNGFIAAAIAAALLLALPLPVGIRGTVRASHLANGLAGYADHFEGALRPIFGDVIAQTLNTLTIRTESGETVKLPFTAPDAQPAPELESQMLELVNQERTKAGLGALAWDPAMAAIARQHSADMFARGYFSHVTPEGASPFDRLSAAGIAYHVAGENIALAPTLSLAHSGLMNSPEHRANILRPEFGRVGIGIVDGGMRGLMVTQDFRN